MGHQRDESRKEIVGVHNGACLQNLFLIPVQISLNLLTFRNKLTNFIHRSNFNRHLILKLTTRHKHRNSLCTENRTMQHFHRAKHKV